MQKRENPYTPAPDASRRISRAATSTWRTSSRWSSGSPPAATSAAWSTQGCAASGRPCNGTCYASATQRSALALVVSIAGRWPVRPARSKSSPGERPSASRNRPESTRPHAEQVFKALAADKGLAAAQATLLNELYILEGRLEHASPDVDADEVRDGRTTPPSTPGFDREHTHLAGAPRRCPTRGRRGRVKTA